VFRVLKDINIGQAVFRQTRRLVLCFDRCRVHQDLDNKRYAMYLLDNITISSLLDRTGLIRVAKEMGGDGDELWRIVSELLLVVFERRSHEKGSLG
jgi:hypothetical protein